MAEDSTAPDAQQQDPEADTQAAANADTAENTPAANPQVDWEKRYKDAQAELTRLAQTRRQLEDRLLALQQAPSAQPTSDAPADETPRERALRLQLEAIEQERTEREWAALQVEYAPIIPGYDVFARGYALDPTPRGALNAFVEGLRAIAGSNPAPEPAGTPKPSRRQATEPVTDPNHPSAGIAQAELEKARSEAVTKHDPATWLAAAMRDKGWIR